MSFSDRFLMARGVVSHGLRKVGPVLLAFSSLFAIAAIAQTDESPAPSSARTQNPELSAPRDAGEMRGLWVVRSSLTSPEKVRRVVETAKKYNLNALFVQVRGRGDAFYDSPHEPRAEALAKQPRDFDPLKQIIAEAHAEGVQVHAWLNTFLTWSGKKAPASPRHLWNAHRDWFACDRKGRRSSVPNKSCEGAFLAPSHPEVQAHLRKVFTHIATAYDVDGIHFDYCRYANRDYDFSPAALARFRAEVRPTLDAAIAARLDARMKKDRLIYTRACGRAWADWRRAQVTNLVGDISREVKAAKPWMQVSAAVFPDAQEAYVERGQDWRGWLQAGHLDAVALMAYAKSTERVLELTRRAVEAAGGKQVYAGIGAWRLSAEDVAEKITQVRRTGAAGVNLFSYDGVHTRPDYLDTLSRSVFPSRAAPRRMRWLPPRPGSASR